MRQFRGLTITTPHGLAWRWIGCTVAHLRGRDVRMEKWQTQCPHCGETVTVRGRLAGGLRRQFYDRRYNAAPSEVVEVRLALPGKHAAGAFDIRSCSNHRRPAAAASPQLVAG
jgi:hypothetical protein